MKLNLTNTKLSLIFGAGVGGLVISFVEGAIAGAKASEACKDKEANTTIEKIKVGGKYFAVPTLIFFASVCGITIPYVTVTKRNAALSALLASTAASYELYKSKVEEMVPEKAKEIKQKILGDTIKKNPQTKDNTVSRTGSFDGEVQTFYDTFTGLYFESSVVRIEKAINIVNRLLLNGDCASLRDLYGEMCDDYKPADILDCLGWTYDQYASSRPIDVEITAVQHNGKPYMAIEYLTNPIFT